MSQNPGHALSTSESSKAHPDEEHVVKGPCNVGVRSELKGQQALQRFCCSALGMCDFLNHLQESIYEVVSATAFTSSVCSASSFLDWMRLLRARSVPYHPRNTSTWHNLW